MEDRTEVTDAMKAVNDGLADALPPSSPPVDEIQYELAIDSNGEEAAFITVVMKDDESGEPYPWTRLKPIHDWIWKVFTDRAVLQRPYVDFRLRSEMGDGGGREHLSALSGA